MCASTHSLPRKSYNFGVKLRARILTTVSDSTSQKFILIGQLDKREQTSGGRFAAVYLDFANTRSRQCGDGDFEDWYARTAKGRECLMGHKVCILCVGCFWCSLTVLNMSLAMVQEEKTRCQLLCRTQVRRSARTRTELPLRRR